MPLLLGVVVELDRAEQIAVIGHGHGGHFLLDGQVHQLRDFAGAVEQRVVGMAMQMDKRRGHGRSNPGGEYQYSEAEQSVMFGCDVCFFDLLDLVLT